jgi:Protein of unknown function (DUF1573)
MRLCFGAFLLTVILAASVPAQAPSISIPQTHFDFGTAVRGAVVEHAFTVVNRGSTAVRIKKVRLTPPLLPANMPVEIPAGQDTALRVKLDTKTLEGAYEGVILLSFDDGVDVQLTLAGRVVLPIEVVPPVIVLTAQRGESKQASVEIVNHEREPVMIVAVRHPLGRYTTRLETVEEVRRFRLTLLLKPDGPAGRNKDSIVLKTSNPAVPELQVFAHTFLHERVYTFPDTVDLGVLRLEDIQQSPELLKSTAQTLMIYRRETSDFQAQVSTDVPGIGITAERGPLGDRYQVTVTLQRESIRVGKISGSIFIATNDSEFPKLTVPVSGEIVGRDTGR